MVGGWEGDVANPVDERRTGSVRKVVEDMIGVFTTGGVSHRVPVNPFRQRCLFTRSTPSAGAAVAVVQESVVMDG